MLPDDPRHGTTRGYAQGCRCRDCMDGRAAYERNRRKRRQALGIHQYLNATGTRRRIHALMRLGWPGYEIARRCGWDTGSAAAFEVTKRTVVQRPTAETVARVYDELSMKLGPSVRTRGIAERNGWLPPLAWDNIDDPNERPAVARDTWDESSIDDAVVDRVLAGGKRPRKLTRAEAGEIVARSLGRGMSGNQIEDLYGLKPERYVRGGERVA